MIQGRRGSKGTWDPFIFNFARECGCGRVETASFLREVGSEVLTEGKMMKGGWRKFEVRGEGVKLWRRGVFSTILAIWGVTKTTIYLMIRLKDAEDQQIVVLMAKINHSDTVLLCLGGTC